MVICFLAAQLSAQWVSGILKGKYCKNIAILHKALHLDAVAGTFKKRGKLSGNPIDISSDVIHRVNYITRGLPTRAE